eukprot:gene12470-346_t
MPQPKRARAEGDSPKPKMLEGIRYQEGQLSLVNQLLLPHKTVYEDVCTVEEAFASINACNALKALVSSTASRYQGTSGPDEAGGRAVLEAYVEGAEAMLIADIKDNEAISRHGANHVVASCLGPAGLSKARWHVTIAIAPPAQAILTPATLSAPFDRVCANGDTANKIGTYSLALLAKAHEVPFYVAAPRTTCAAGTASGNEGHTSNSNGREHRDYEPGVTDYDNYEVVIEERPTTEITHNTMTDKRVVTDSPLLHVMNPSFDVTPASLITGGIITEMGVLETGPNGTYDVTGFLEQNKGKKP